MTSDRPEPRPWSDIRDDDRELTVGDLQLNTGPTYVTLGGALRMFDGELYALVEERDDGEDLWLEFDHYVHRAANGDLPGLDPDPAIPTG